MNTIYFDLDGTIVDFYGVTGWLKCLENEDPYPYMVAEPRMRMSSLARQLNNLQKKGFKLGIVSWLSKDSSEEFSAEITRVKMEWLDKHLHSVTWDEIKIVPYGTPKHEVVDNPMGFLFDDEDKNRHDWTGLAFDVDNIPGYLKIFSHYFS